MSKKPVKKKAKTQSKAPKRPKNAPAGFVFGDHQFFGPSQNGPISRLTAPKKQIHTAPPPTYLDGYAVESTKKSKSATMLLKGKFCGHGEPTMTVFDIVIDGETELEISALSAPENPDANVPLLAVRKPGGKWFALFRREWEERSMMLEGVKQKAVSRKEAAVLDEETLRGEVSIGFEYPCDAGSRDDVSWVTIDVFSAGKKKPWCAVNAELA